MLKLARWTIAHRRLVVAAWIVLALGLLGAATSAGSSYSNNLTLPGTGSQREVDLLKGRFPSQAGDQDQIVFQARTGKLTSAGDRATIAATLRKVARLPHVTSVVSPYSTGGRAISASGTIGFATVQFNETAAALPTSAANRVISTAQSARSRNLNVQLGGAAIENALRPSIGFSTAIGVLAAIVILLISFGSVIAMSLPIITAAVGVVAGVGAIELISHALSMPNFSAQLAIMIGLGVGVDYALFIVTRFRENYRTNGGDVNDAVEAAFDTAGRAVLFAGITVVLALLGLFTLGISLLNAVAVAIVLGVILVLAASLTLLPPLLRITGHRVGRVRHSSRDGSDAQAPTGFWTRWVSGVQRHPALTAVAATAVMLAIASPILGLRLGNSDASNDATGQTTRQAFDLLAKGFGPGFNGPLQIAVAQPSPNNAAVARFTHALSATPGIASVAPARTSPDGTAAAILADPATSPQSSQTTTLVKHLRSSVLPQIEHSTGAQAYVGGPTATQIDFSHVLSNKLAVFIATVVGFGALLLLLVFRSLLIPLQAAVMNVFTIGASLGVTTLVFQHGDLGSLFSAQSGPIDSFIPVIAFAIIFGLSTDYEVFLVSRIHEEWRRRNDATAAIREGFGHTARVVVAAAAVVFCVFGAFAISGDRVLGEFGLALAAGVLLDVVLMRILLLPAVLQLLGRSAWTLPHQLEQRLPHINIDPESTAPRRPPEPALEARS